MRFHKPGMDICGSERKPVWCASMAFDSFHGCLPTGIICPPLTSLRFWAHVTTLKVEKLFLDRENALWVGTLKQGLYRIRDRKVDHFQSVDGLSSDTVYEFYEDTEGHLWVATAKGIDCFRDVRVATFSTREGLSADEVDAVLACRGGTVWIGTSE